jgi:hypothetical protein
MKLEKINTNLTLVELNSYNVFFSYSQVIAIENIKEGFFYITSNKYSVTTSKHLNYIKKNYVLKTHIIEEVTSSMINSMI